MKGDVPGSPGRTDDGLFEMAQEEYQRASRRLDEGGLSEATLAAAVRRLLDVAGMIADPSLRAAVIGDAEELRAAPAARREGTGADAGGGDERAPSAQLRDAQGLVAWAWEDLPDMVARRARISDVLRRIQRLPESDDAVERREISELQAQLVRLDAALAEADA